MTEVTITPEVKSRLAALENEHGQLTPSLVVADARQKDSPLHAMFDWNIKEAAEKWWLQQARTIIRSVKLVITTENIAVHTPHYVRDPSVGGKEQGYISVAQLQRDPIAARASLKLEFGRAESALNRARSLASVLNLEDEIDLLLVRVSGLREQVDIREHVS